jgi:molybdopterin-containing oxidoreductase family iron-sulfur binding subunit
VGEERAPLNRAAGPPAAPNAVQAEDVEPAAAGRDADDTDADDTDAADTVNLAAEPAAADPFAADRVGGGAAGAAGTGYEPPPWRDLELVFLVSPAVHDGRFAGNAWMQELPDPMTKLVWGNAALVAPATAAELGVGDGDEVLLTAGGRKLLVPVALQPGQAERTVALALG